MQESNISISSSHLSRGNALDSVQPVGIMLLKCYSKMNQSDLEKGNRRMRVRS